MNHKQGERKLAEEIVGIVGGDIDRNGESYDTEGTIRQVQKLIAESRIPSVVTAEMVEQALDYAWDENNSQYDDAQIAYFLSNKLRNAQLSAETSAQDATGEDDDCPILRGRDAVNFLKQMGEELQPWMLDKRLKYLEACSELSKLLETPKALRSTQPTSDGPSVTASRGGNSGTTPLPFSDMVKEGVTITGAVEPTSETGAQELGTCRGGYFAGHNYHEAPHRRDSGCLDWQPLRASHPAQEDANGKV